MGVILDLFFHLPSSFKNGTEAKNVVVESSDTVVLPELMQYKPVYIRRYMFALYCLELR